MAKIRKYVVKILQCRIYFLFSLPMSAFLCCIFAYSKIDPSELAAKGVLRARRCCCLRKETAFSPESAAGSSEAGSYRSPLKIVGGVLEL